MGNRKGMRGKKRGPTTSKDKVSRASKSKLSRAMASKGKLSMASKGKRSRTSKGKVLRTSKDKLSRAMPSKDKVLRQSKGKLWRASKDKLSRASKDKLSRASKSKLSRASKGKLSRARARNGKVLSAVKRLVSVFLTARVARSTICLSRPCCAQGSRCSLPKGVPTAGPCSRRATRPSPFPLPRCSHKPTRPCCVTSPSAWAPPSTCFPTVTLRANGSSCS